MLSEELYEMFNCFSVSSNNSINVSTKSLDSLWASEQSLFNTNALKMHMLATKWDICYKLAVSWVCIVD